MARAYGSSAHLFMKRDDLGAGGDRQLHPHALQPLQSRQRAGPDRRPGAGSRSRSAGAAAGRITDEGDIVVAVDPRYLGSGSPAYSVSPTPRIIRWQLRSGVRLGCRGPAELHDRGRDVESAGVLRARRRQAQLDRAGVQPLGSGGGHHQRHRPRRDTVRHDPGPHAHRPDFQPHQPVPGLD
jgi:hypothetical protein